ncbi:arylsulfotransferase family protein [bacterium]|nr:arylsulfotransferase family protein [bacterium]
MKSDRKNFLEILLLLGAVAVLTFLVQQQEGRSVGEREPLASVSESRAKQAPPASPEGGLEQEKKKTKGVAERIPADAPFEGYTLYATSGTAEVLLTNTSGDFVKRWEIDADRARLLPNGDLLVVHGSKWGLQREPWASLRSVIRKYRWDGSIVWEHELPGEAHHDIVPLANGNILAVYLTRVPKALIREKLGKQFERVHIRSDVLVEISPAGEEVWRWASHEHLSLRDCGARSCPDLSKEEFLSGKRRFDWTHINTVRELPQNQWVESGDARFAPGNILIFPRNFWSALLIDKPTGEVVWRYHGEGERGISGGHESYMIPPGYPGAGNILIFDNGRIHEQSRVLEVHPLTKQVVWSYADGPRFFSRVAGAAQRLPNGNTLISEDTSGRIFEVNSAGKEVWSHHAYKIRINRAHRYPPDYAPQFAALSANEDG